MHFPHIRNVHHGIVQVQKSAIFGSTGLERVARHRQSEKDREEKKMAHSLAARHGRATPAWGEVHRLVNAAMQRFTTYRAYRRTVQELSGLSNHALADLGLDRSEIRRAASDSVYGARR